MLQQTFFLFSLAVSFILCSVHRTEAQVHRDLKSNTVMKDDSANPATGMKMLIVKLKTTLSEEEFLRRAREREPQFAALPGLIQKYYIKLGTEGEYGGVYIWDSAESLQAFKASTLAATIAQAYEGIEAPSIEVVDILFQLRE